MTVLEALQLYDLKALVTANLDQAPVRTKAYTVYGPVNDYTGYGQHTLATVRHLDANGYQVCLIPIGKPEVHEALVTRCCQVPAQGARLVIQPPSYPPLEADYWFTMHETTALPTEWLRVVNRAGHVIVPSYWNASCFQAQGVTRPLSICPLGVDLDLFAYAEGPEDACVFGAAANTSLSVAARKNIELAVQAFCRAFPREQDVELRIKLLPSCQPPVASDPRIKVTQAVLSGVELAVWLQGLTAFVLPSRAEAWSFLALQAMACGKPVLAASFGGVTEFFNGSNGYPVEYKLTSPKECYAGAGLWAEPSLDSMVDRMRQVYKERQSKGRLAREAAEAFSWVKGLRRLEAILAEEPSAPPAMIVPLRPSVADTCLVCLGRFGDIMNALPLAQDLALKAQAPVGFMVAAPFLSLLEGVSYVVPEIYAGDYGEIKKACAQARKKYSVVVPAQVYGTERNTPTAPSHYNVRAWTDAGYVHRWSDSTLRLNFDRRDRVRERKLIEAHVKLDSRPLLLLGLHGGGSSPFTEAAQFKADLYAALGTIFQVLDLAEVKAERLYDLLGLFDLAAGLVTIDTAFVHLASACPRMPVLLLMQDIPWYQTVPRCQCPLSVTYGSWRGEWTRITETLRGWSLPPKVVHAYEVHPADERVARAQSTWETFKSLGWEARPLCVYPRDTRLLGETKSVPFLKDIMAEALTGLAPDDIIVFTNDDIILLPPLNEELLRYLSVVPCLMSSRRDIQVFEDVSKIRKDIVVHEHWGRDLIACRAWWLREQWDELPDYAVGFRDWDIGFLCQMRKSCGVGFTGVWNWKQSFTLTACEIASPYVLHEVHDAYHETHRSSPATLWNEVLLVTWQKRYAPELSFPWANPFHERFLKGELTFNCITNYEQ